MSGPAWAGRGQLVEPVLRTWPPLVFIRDVLVTSGWRCHLLRSKLDGGKKLVRQIEALLRKLKAGCRSGDPHSFEAEIQFIWLAIVGAPIRPRFPPWSYDVVGFAPQVLPGVVILETLYQAATDHAQGVSRKRWASKREAFKEQVEDSWNGHGGRFPFRLLREQQQPPVMEMRLRTQL